MATPDHQLPITDGGGVPVFDCHVLLRQTDSGQFVARAANLDGVEGRGGTEREALQSIVRTFKDTVASLVQQGQEIPFRQPPATPDDDEVERWIPVHL